MSNEGFTTCYAHEDARREENEVRLERQERGDDRHHFLDTWRWQNIPNGTRVQECEDSFHPELGLGGFGTVNRWGWARLSREPAYIVQMEDGQTLALSESYIMPMSLVAYDARYAQEQAGYLERVRARIAKHWTTLEL